MASYSRALDKAFHNRQLVLLVPTGNPAQPLSREIGWWENALERWEGDWRYDNSKGNWAKADPIAWAPLLAIDVALIKEFTDKTSKKALTPKPKGASRKPELRLAKSSYFVDMTTGKPIQLKVKTPKRTRASQPL